VKKRTEKKLTLSRETLQCLEASYLREAAAGLTGASACVTHCVYPTNANISVCKRCNA
jgi:hypothetical protein